jgi:succinoglycan biosynthesis protein ExoA
LANHRDLAQPEPPNNRARIRRMQHRSSPRFSVIVPAPSIDPSPALLDDLQTLGESQSLEVLIATGSNPSRQRNLAAAKARGDWLVFLDSDCRLEGVYFDKLADHTERGLEIVGGPVLLLAGASHLEVMFQSLLSHRLLTGPSSARYGSGGALRRCDDAQLILCNLAVRRDLFWKSKGFEERLYPNEENEWLARLHASGVPCWHDPELIVRRPQRQSRRAYTRMLIRYGRGRTRQFIVSGIWDAARQLPVLVLLALLGLFVFRPRLATKASIAIWLGLGAACKAIPGSPGAQRLPAMAALIAPSVPLLYALGQVMEFLRPTPQEPAGEVRVYRWEPKPGIVVPVE